MKVLNGVCANRLALRLIAVLVLSSGVANGGMITISGTAITDPKDRLGDPLSTGNLSYLVVDTLGDGFASLLEGMTIQPGAYIPNTDDWVVQTRTSKEVFGAPYIGVESTFDNASNDIDVNDPFGVFFFDNLTLAADGDTSSALTTSHFYGFASNADWKIRSAPNSSGFNNSISSDSLYLQASNISATSQVMAAVPEPNGALFLGFGWFVYLLGFKRSRKGA